MIWKYIQIYIEVLARVAEIDHIHSDMFESCSLYATLVLLELIG